MNFIVDRGNLTLRSCDSYLCSNGKHTHAEIVCWNQARESCWSIAHWVRSAAEYDLLFVGDRPFRENIECEDFWRLARIGQELLNNELDKNEGKD